MLKKIHLLLAFALALPAASYGLVGGPWDNGDYSSTLDAAGIYQATMRFTNGQGMCQFSTSAASSIYIAPTGAATGNTPTNALTIENRSVIYYKGVTYLGSCTGTTDMSRKTIQGITNGSSDVGSGGPNITTPNGSYVDPSTEQFSNGGRGFTCNTYWSGKIGPYGFIMQFTGTGQLTVLTPDSGTQTSAIIGNLVNDLDTKLGAFSVTDGSYTAAQINSINATLATLQFLTTGQFPTFNAAGQLTSPSLGSLPPEAAVPKGSDLVDQAADTVCIKVSGVRKFFPGGSQQ